MPIGTRHCLSRKCKSAAVRMQSVQYARLSKNSTIDCPEEIFEHLMLHVREIRYTLLRQKLVAGYSYAAAGRCFLRLIEDRKRHFLVP
jgi:hypothetical protein